MTGATLTAMLVSLLVTLLAELGARPLFGSRPRGKRRPPHPTLAIGLILGFLITAHSGSAVQFYAFLIGAIVLFASGLYSDYNVSRSRRHFWSTIIATIPLALGGYVIDHLGVPGLPRISVSPFAGVAFTFLWVFVIVGIIEVCSLIPFIAAIISLAVGLSVFLPVSVNQTFMGHALAGCLVGATLGRALGQFLLGHVRSPDKAEVLVLGYFLAVATLSLFLKSFALAGLIVPLSLIIIFVAVLVLQSFERSLILRPMPRN